MAASTVKDLVQFMSKLAPLKLAADWDNVGLLVGDEQASVERVMTCLTVTPETVAEAVREKVNVIVTHHPVLLKGAKRLTTQNPEGRMLTQLIRSNISVYSAHTAFDNSDTGVNEQIARALGLQKVVPLRLQAVTEHKVGEGRVGVLKKPQSVQECATVIKKSLHCDQLQICGNLKKEIQRVAIVCGAGGEFLRDALKTKADLIITGEMRFHDVLHAQACGLAVMLPGHYATERFALETLAAEISAEFKKAHVWASRDERDPITTV